MKTLVAAVCLATLLFCSCEPKSSDNSNPNPFISDGAVLVSTVNGNAFKYPGKNPSNPFMNMNSFIKGDSVIGNSYFQMISSHKGLTLQFINLRFSLGNDQKLSDQEFLQGIKPGYYTLGGTFLNQQWVSIAYSDSTGIQWLSSGTQKGSSFYIASTAMSSLQGRPAIKATVIFNCTLYPESINDSIPTHIPISGSAQIFFPKP